MRTLDVAAPPLAGHPPVAARVYAVEGDLDRLAASRMSAAICCAGVDRVVLDVTAAGAVEAGAMSDLLLAARVVGIAVDVVPAGAVHASTFSVMRPM
jgi:hypothetical protein